MEALQNLDISVLLFIQENLRNSILTPVMTTITHLGDAGIFWIILTLVLLIMRRTRRIGLGAAISLVICAIVTNLLLKNIVARIRPYDAYNAVKLIIPRQKDFSFPSGHTAASFACAAVLLKELPRRFGIPAIILAIIIAFSRLYVGVHYPGDVLGGAIIGLTSCIGSRAVCRRIPMDRISWLALPDSSDESDEPDDGAQSKS